MYLIFLGIRYKSKKHNIFRHDSVFAQSFKEPLRFQVLKAASMKFRVLDRRTASIIVALMMEAVRTSEMSVNFNVTTRRYIPEDSKLLKN
jgi:hypothetical protein